MGTHDARERERERERVREREKRFYRMTLAYGTYQLEAGATAPVSLCSDISSVTTQREQARCDLTTTAEVLLASLAGVSAAVAAGLDYSCMASMVSLG